MTPNKLIDWEWVCDFGGLCGATVTRAFSEGGNK